jgi:superfamily I DNA and/or RNA helicase
MVSLPYFSHQFGEFDCVVIDNANIITPLELILPMFLGKKIVLAGDQYALPLRVGSYLISDLADGLNLEEGERDALETPLFQALYENCPPELRQSLKGQSSKVDV